LIRNILIISDRRAGHFRQSEAIALALTRAGDTRVEWLNLEPRMKGLTRIYRALFNNKSVTSPRLLTLAYKDFKMPATRPDVIVSAGGTTLPANVALSRIFNVPNIFSGSLRNSDAEMFTAVLTPYVSLREQPNHLFLPKPSPIDPEKLRPIETWSTANPPSPYVGALLLGGPSGVHDFSPSEWQDITKLLEAGDTSPFSWVVTTSPRTPKTVVEAMARAAKASPRVLEFVDYRSAGAGSVSKLLDQADFVVCTEDSSSMLIEAICAQRPTIALQPQDRRMTPQEEFMLADLCGKRHLTRIAIQQDLSLAIAKALEHIVPMADNHLDILAAALNARMITRAA